MRVKIVVQDPAWLTGLPVEGKDMQALLRTAVRRARQLLCGLRGHDQQARLHQRRLVLYCRACGHTTPGWELGEPRLKSSASPDRPRFLELLRKRG
jgi:hypothetical protein